MKLRTQLPLLMMMAKIHWIFILVIVFNIYFIVMYKPDLIINQMPPVYFRLFFFVWYLFSFTV